MTCKDLARAPRNVRAGAAFPANEGAMPDGLGVTNLVGSMLEERAVLQAKEPH